MGDDWKRVLFVWRGIIDEEMNWKGAWCSTDDPIDEFPSEEDFKDSENTFSLGKTEANNKIDEEIHGDLKYSSSYFDNGSYLLDQGDGHESYKDTSHHYILIENITDDTIINKIVIAYGNTEFGKFVSKGIIVNNTLTLARRYLSKGDIRLGIINKKSSSSIEIAKALWNNHISDKEPWNDIPFFIKKSIKRKVGD